VLLLSLLAVLLSTFAFLPAVLYSILPADSGKASRHSHPA